MQKSYMLTVLIFVAKLQQLYLSYTVSIWVKIFYSSANSGNLQNIGQELAKKFSLPSM